IRRAALLGFLDSLGADPPLVVLDEAYREFCDDPEYPDGVALLARYPRLIVLRTFSKIAGLAGLRVGYAVANAETIDRLNRVRGPADRRPRPVQWHPAGPGRRPGRAGGGGAPTAHAPSRARGGYVSQR